MSKYNLKSHEDLSGYLQSLDDAYAALQSSIKSAPSFSADSQTIIEDLLSQLVTSRRKALDIIKIAKKFYKVSAHNSDLIKEMEAEKNALETEISELFAKINAQDKEIEGKDNRIENMSHDSMEFEKDYKIMAKELQQLRKEVQILKKDQTKTLAPQRHSMMRNFQEVEDTSKLKEEIDCYKDEIRRKCVEIEELQRRIKEIDAGFLLEKASAEKIKMTVITLKKENLELKDRIDELEFQNSHQNELLENVNHELIMQKNYTENLVKEYDKERRSSSVTGGISNEIQALIEEEKLKEIQNSADSSEEQKNDARNRLSYKANAPKMENLAELIGKESNSDDSNSEDVETTDVSLKFQVKNSLTARGHERKSTFFVLSSPIVNYDRKFQFPDINIGEFTVEFQEHVSVPRVNRGEKAVEMLKNKKKPQIFTFDEDENGETDIPVEKIKGFTMETVGSIGVERKTEIISLFFQEFSMGNRKNPIEVSETCGILIRKKEKCLEIVCEAKVQVFALQRNEENLIEVKDVALEKHLQIENCDIFTIRNQFSQSLLETCPKVTEIMIKLSKGPVKNILSLQTPSVICSIFPISSPKPEEFPKVPHKNLSLQTFSLQVVSKSLRNPLNSNQDDQDKPKNEPIKQEPLSRDPIKDFFILVFSI